MKLESSGLRKDMTMKRFIYRILILLVLCTGVAATYHVTAYAEGEEEYTEEEKEQAKAWLSAHGYPPTRAGADAAYADFLAGKFDDDPEVMRIAREHGLIDDEPVEPGSEHATGDDIFMTVDTQGNVTSFMTYNMDVNHMKEKATPDEATPAEATPAVAKTEKPTPTQPKVATPADTEKKPEIGRKVPETSLGMKILKVVYIIVGVLLIAGLIILLVRRR